MPCESGPSVGDEINMLTRLLCEACGLLDSAKSKPKSQELERWWRQHQEWDKIRRAEEKRRERELKAARKQKYEELKREFE